MPKSRICNVTLFCENKILAKISEFTVQYFKKSLTGTLSILVICVALQPDSMEIVLLKIFASLLIWQKLISHFFGLKFQCLTAFEHYICNTVTSLMSLNFVSCFHGIALLQHERMWLDALQQQSLLCMILCTAFSEAKKFIAYICHLTSVHKPT